MYQQKYYVARATGTYADALAAFGLARLLRALIHQRNRARGHRRERSRITIHDLGSAYEVELPFALDAKLVRSADFIGDLAPLMHVESKGGNVRLKRTRSTPSGEESAESDELEEPPAEPATETDQLSLVTRTVEYGEIWGRLRAASQIRKHWQDVGKGTPQRAELQQLYEQFREPGQDIALLVGDYRMQATGIHNQLILRWHQTRSHQERNLNAILELCSDPTADVEKIARAWRKDVDVAGTDAYVTCSQLFNPSMGKGQNRGKADALAIGNRKEFWLLAYLRVIGLHEATASRRVRARRVRDEDTQKVYVLLPDSLSLAWHQNVFEAFQRALPRATSVRLDILASLAYAWAWLENTDTDQPLSVSRGSETVHGLAVATYRLLSRNSYTMVNLATLGLPPWLRTDGVRGTRITRRDVNVLKEVISEQRRIINPLREDRNDEFNLLATYREFLTGHHLDSFFEFCAGYGEHLLRVLDETGRAAMMSVRSIDELLRRIDMSDLALTRRDLQEFTSDSSAHPGFHRVARAIYASTIRPQRQKAEHRRNPAAAKPVFEVRYGLASSLRRKTDSDEEFIHELTEFIQLYNAETWQQYENDARDSDHGTTMVPKRVVITRQDIDDVIDLVGHYHAPLVCNVLLAYGYAAQGPRARAEGPEAAPEPAEGDMDVDDDGNEENNGE